MLLMTEETERNPKQERCEQQKETDVGREFEGKITISLISEIIAFALSSMTNRALPGTLWGSDSGTSSDDVEPADKHW
jgi:hypothetical protein